MARKCFFIFVMMFMALSLQAQHVEHDPVRDPNNKYLVWTGNVRDVPTEKALSDSISVSTKVEKESSYMDRYFPYRSMCDWTPGMRFMVLPEKKDMVIRTFTDSLTDELVGSMSLRYKIMVYNGFTRERLHDRVWFREETTRKAYYYELPTRTFEDYCYMKRGVPTLAYLDEIDSAMVHLVGKKLETNYGQYNVDVSTTSYGYDKVPVAKGTIVTVKAVGVGSRSFPVKMIVEDKDGNQFYQNVAISRTNSGMSDDEFNESDNIKHTFAGSFKMLDSDEIDTQEEYDYLIGKYVVTLRSSVMVNQYNVEENVDRLTEFVIKGVNRIGESDYSVVTLEKDGKTFSKIVTFVRQPVSEGVAVSSRGDYFNSLFRVGSLSMEGVRAANMPYIRQGIVRAGFTEEEVKLALGEPDETGTSKRGTAYTWIYKSVINRTQHIVYFNNRTRRVTSVSN